LKQNINQIDLSRILFKIFSAHAVKKYSDALGGDIKIFRLAAASKIHQWRTPRRQRRFGF
jgi:hypothetical protein